MKALIIIGFACLGLTPLWPLCWALCVMYSIVAIPYGAMRCMVYLQTGAWTQ
jgi:hypothetical protein